MLNLTQKTLDKIKSVLIKQQKEVEEELQDLEKDDPMLIEGKAESLESGTESWQQEVHGRLMTLKTDLLGLSSRIKDSLLRLNKGTYGKCEKCGKDIEPERLKAMPTANLCISCSKKTPTSKR